MNYFDEGTYAALFDALQEFDPDAAAEFASYFTHDGSYYICNNPSGYSAFLNDLFGGDPDGDFLAWTGVVTGKSTQGSGTN